MKIGRLWKSAALIALGAAFAGGCSHYVDAKRVDQLSRGTRISSVEESLGREGRFVFDVQIEKARYRCVEYQVGHTGDPYYFVYRDGRLDRIVRPLPRFGGGVDSTPAAMRQPDYLWEHSQRVFDSPDVPSPPDRFPEPSTQPSRPNEVVGYMIVVIPVEIAFSPILLPMLAFAAASVKQYDPTLIHPGEPVAQVDKTFGPPIRVWDGGKFGQWRRYQQNSTTALPPDVFCVVVLFRDGLAAGIFSDAMVNDLP